MKVIAQIARILVGLEFIFSGFVKVVDPYGTGIKLQEYFEVFAQDMPSMAHFFEFFAQHSQTLSLIFCATELILGVALLVGFRVRFTAWIVLGLMTFFTFLTFYSAYFNKVTDCGCFGDFLHLKPWHSFLKDVISMVVILVIFIYRSWFKPIPFAGILVSVATIIAFGIGIYGLRYLPIIDFLPYAVGKSIPDQMKPTGIKPEFEYTFLDKKANKEIVAKEFLMDTTAYKYVSSIVLNEDLVKPKITDYSVSDKDGNTITDSTFMGAKLFIIFKKIEHLEASQVKALAALGKDLNGSNITPMLLTSGVKDDFAAFTQKNAFSTPYYFIDEKVLKTMARTNPCVILLENGVVKAKWGAYAIPSKEEVLSKLK